ncbi:MAG: hypothetical protein IJ646_00890 [Clostridia bacterium]|nr:hypothetical protein [Clostridia bacterium]
MNGLYTQFPADLAESVQMNAGIIVDDFTPSTGEIGRILGATNSGISFDPKPTYEDFGADIDNVPANTMQLKRVARFDPVVSGSFRTMTAALAKRLNAAGAVAAGDETHIVPSHALTVADFADVWVIGDYSNAGGNGTGFIAVHLRNALNATGFKWKTNKDGKGEFDYQFHGHYDLDHPDEVPFEIYVRPGVAA